MITKAIRFIKNSKYLVAFTGAGISVESGIPPFRGENGIWNKYDMSLLNLSDFKNNAENSWKTIKEIFFDYLDKIEPNEAHYCLAELEKNNILKATITQNIDNLHQKGGSKNVIEFHGNSHSLICMDCKNKYPVTDIDLRDLPPSCSKCGGLLKPDFIFFGEAIHEDAYKKSVEAMQKADIVLVIGTTGVIYPASNLPHLAKENGATIIEINIGHSDYTNTITDILLQGTASEMLRKLTTY